MKKISLKANWAQKRLESSISYNELVEKEYVLFSGRLYSGFSSLHHLTLCFVFKCTSLRSSRLARRSGFPLLLFTLLSLTRLLRYCSSLCAYVHSSYFFTLIITRDKPVIRSKLQVGVRRIFPSSLTALSKKAFTCLPSYWHLSSSSFASN